MPSPPSSSSSSSGTSGSSAMASASTGAGGRGGRRFARIPGHDWDNGVLECLGLVQVGTMRSLGRLGMGLRSWEGLSKQKERTSAGAAAREERRALQSLRHGAPCPLRRRSARRGHFRRSPRRGHSTIGSRLRVHPLRRLGSRWTRRGHGRRRAAAVAVVVAARRRPRSRNRGVSGGRPLRVPLHRTRAAGPGSADVSE